MLMSTPQYCQPSLDILLYDDLNQTQTFRSLQNFTLKT